MREAVEIYGAETDDAKLDFAENFLPIIKSN